MRRLVFPHLALWVLGAGVLRVAVVPPERCDVPTGSEARAVAVAAGDWLADHAGSDGRYLYGYHAADDRVSTDYNLVRHAGVMVSLYQLAALEPRYLEAADAGLSYARQRLTEHGDWTAFAPAGSQPGLGASALLTAALAQRRVVTGDESMDDLMRRLGRFLAVQRRPDGSMLDRWDPATAEPVPEVYGTFSTGEAFWALRLLDSAFPDEEWGGHAAAVGRYLAVARDRAEGNPFRRPDHWAAYGFAEGGGAPLDEAELDYVRSLAGFFGATTRIESQRTGAGIEWLTRPYPAIPSNIGTTGEGLAALWRLSHAEPVLADLRPDLERRIGCVSGLLVDRQGAVPSGREELTAGAWFNHRAYTQMDDQQHAISALVAALPLLEAR